MEEQLCAAQHRGGGGGGGQQEEKRRGSRWRGQGGGGDVCQEGWLGSGRNRRNKGSLRHSPPFFSSAVSSPISAPHLQPLRPFFFFFPFQPFFPVHRSSYLSSPSFPISALHIISTPAPRAFERPLTAAVPSWEASLAGRCAPARSRRRYSLAGEGVKRGQRRRVPGRWHHTDPAAGRRLSKLPQFTGGRKTSSGWTETDFETRLRG